MNPVIDHAIRCQERLQKFLRQPVDRGQATSESWSLLGEAMAAAEPAKPPPSSAG